MGYSANKPPRLFVDCRKRTTKDLRRISQSMARQARKPGARYSTYTGRDWPRFLRSKSTNFPRTAPNSVMWTTITIGLAVENASRLTKPDALIIAARKID